LDTPSFESSVLEGYAITPTDDNPSALLYERKASQMAFNSLATRKNAVQYTDDAGGVSMPRLSAAPRSCRDANIVHQT
jgi:hypothetical protein